MGLKAGGANLKVCIWLHCRNARCLARLQWWYHYVTDAVGLVENMLSISVRDGKKMAAITLMVSRQGHE